jgi:4'-phosphopantetheinyl transferase
LRLDEGETPIEMLPAADRERALALRSGSVRSRWVAARWGLLRILGRYTGRAPIEVQLTSGEFGKPALAEAGAPLRFSLSHSGAAALVALASRTEVGVDLEQIVERDDLVALAERGIGPTAAAAVEQAPAARRRRSFYAEWVRHEAAAKCAGVGLSQPLPDVPMSTVNLDVGDDWAAAVAVASPRPPQVRLFELES